MRRGRQQFRRAKRRGEEMTEEKFITKPCRNCLNEECVWKGTADNFKLCEDYKVNLSKTDLFNDIKAEIKELNLIGYAAIGGKRELAERAVLNVIEKHIK